MNTVFIKIVTTVEEATALTCQKHRYPWKLTCKATGLDSPVISHSITCGCCIKFSTNELKLCSRQLKVISIQKEQCSSFK